MIKGLQALWLLPQDVRRVRDTNDSLRRELIAATAALRAELQRSKPAVSVMLLGRSKGTPVTYAWSAQLEPGERRTGRFRIMTTIDPGAWLVGHNGGLLSRVLVGVHMQDFTPDGNGPVCALPVVPVGIDVVFDVELEPRPRPERP